MEEPGENGVRRFIGRVLIVVGTLWLALTGLCTAIIAIAHRENELAYIVLFCGTISALIGGMIYSIGAWLRPPQLRTPLNLVAGHRNDHD